MATFDVFSHMLYEIKKGVRSLALLTTSVENIEMIKRKLNNDNYDYILESVNSKCVNIFFGTFESVEVVRKFRKNSLKEFSTEEDFILGILLGYKIEEQCKRYLKRKTA